MNIDDILIDDDSIYANNIYTEEKVELITANKVGLYAIDIHQKQIDKLQKENQLLKKQLKRQQQNFRMRYR